MWLISKQISIRYIQEINRNLLLVSLQVISNSMLGTIRGGLCCTKIFCSRNVITITIGDCLIVYLSSLFYTHSTLFALNLSKLCKVQFFKATDNFVLSKDFTSKPFSKKNLKNKKTNVESCIILRIPLSS